MSFLPRYQHVLISSLLLICILIPVTLKAKAPAEKSGEALRLLVDQSKLGAANKWIQQAPQDIQQSAPVLYQQARIALKTNARADKGYIGYRYTPKGSQTAIAFLKKAQEANPNYSKIYSLRGHIYAIGGELEKAKKNFEKAEALPTKHVWLDFNKALLAIKQENYQEAARLFRKNTLKNVKQNKSDPDLNARNSIYQHSWDMWKRISLDHPELDAIASVRKGVVKRVLPHQFPDFLKNRKKSDKPLFVHFSSGDDFCQPCLISNPSVGKVAAELIDYYDFVLVSFEPWNFVGKYPDIAKPEQIIALPSQGVYRGSKQQLFQVGNLCTTNCKKVIERLKDALNKS